MQNAQRRSTLNRQQLSVGGQMGNNNNHFENAFFLKSANIGDILGPRKKKSSVAQQGQLREVFLKYLLKIVFPLFPGPPCLDVIEDKLFRCVGEALLL